MKEFIAQIAYLVWIILSIFYHILHPAGPFDFGEIILGVLVLGVLGGFLISMGVYLFLEILFPNSKY